MYDLFDTIISWLVLIFGVGAPLFIIFRAIGIKGFREITVYSKYNTFLYRTNPVIKIIMTITIMMVVTTSIWWIGAILTAAVLSLYITLENGKRKLYIGSLFIISTLVGSIWGYAPFVTFSTLNTVFPHFVPDVIWTWPSYFAVLGYQHTLTLQALEYSFQISFRSTAIMASALILVMTNTPTQILRTLHKFRVPDSIILSLMVAMRTVSFVLQYLDESIKIQMMRGLGSKHSKFLKPIFYFVAALQGLVPTIIHIMRGGKDTGISVDTRGFKATKKRSYVEENSIDHLDYYVLVVIVMLVIMDVTINIMGFGRVIPYN